MTRRRASAPGDRHARDLLGTRAVVTGGTRGIGAAIAGTLARRGARVLVSARNPAPGLPEGVRLVVADAATAEGAGRLAAEAEQVLGEVDVLVNNAGGVMPVPGGIGAIADEEWRAVIAANLLSAVRLDRLLIPGMRARRRGVIVHVSSSTARQPAGQIAHYGAAKAALANYSKALALDRTGSGSTPSRPDDHDLRRAGSAGHDRRSTWHRRRDRQAGDDRPDGRDPARPPRRPGRDRRTRRVSWCRTEPPGSPEATSRSTAACERRSEPTATPAPGGSWASS